MFFKLPGSFVGGRTENDKPWVKISIVKSLENGKNQTVRLSDVVVGILRYKRCKKTHVTWCCTSKLTDLADDYDFDGVQRRHSRPRIYVVHCKIKCTYIRLRKIFLADYCAYCGDK